MQLFRKVQKFIILERLIKIYAFFDAYIYRCMCSILHTIEINDYGNHILEIQKRDKVLQNNL